MPDIDIWPYHGTRLLLIKYECDTLLAKQMEAMSLKKLRRKLDAKKEYHIEYTNKKGNFISATIEGRNNG